MAVSREEYLWNESSSNLRKLRYGREKKKPDIPNKRLVTRSRQHAPVIDRYPDHWPGQSHSTQLPRLETPPDHGSPAQLRGSKYHVVPPVVRQYDAYERSTSGGDNWGVAEPGDSEDDGYLPYPPPPIGYYPYKNPSYPPYQHGATNKVQYHTGTQSFEKSVRFDNKNRHRPVEPNTKDYRSDQSSYEHRSPDTGSPSDGNRGLYLRGDQYSSVNKRSGRSRVYKLLNEGGSPDIQDLNPGHKLLRSSNVYHPSERYDQSGSQSFRYIAPLSSPSESYMQPNHVPTRDSLPIKEPLHHTVHGAMRHEPSQLELAAHSMTQLLDNTVEEECVKIVRETIQELASDYVLSSAIYDAYDEMVVDIIKDMGEDVVEAAMYENVLDDVIEEKIFKPAVRDELEEVALEVLEHFDSRLRRKEQREIDDHASGKLMDSICLNVLLDIIARQGKLQTETEYAEKFVEGVMFNFLLEQYYHVQSVYNLSTENYALKRHLERVVTDAALDALLDEACLTLDQDMADIDEAEAGLPGPKLISDKQKPYQSQR